MLKRVKLYDFGHASLVGFRNNEAPPQISGEENHIFGYNTRTSLMYNNKKITQD